MSLKNLFIKIRLVLLLVVISVGSVSATDYYVSKTNGDDLNNNGTSFSDAFLTIGAALDVVADGDRIFIHAGTYNDATEDKPILVNQSITLTAVEINNATVVVLPDGFTINGAGKTVELATESASESFLLQDGADNALSLADGTLNIDPAKVTVDNGSTISRADGTINATPTTTNVDVVYNGSTGDVTAGPEIPADLGTGDLTVNNVGNVTTFPAALTAVDITATEEAVFQSPVELSGTLTVDSDVDFESTLDATGGTGETIDVNAAAILDLQAGANVDADIDVAATGAIQLNDQFLYWGSSVAGLTLTNAGEIYSDASVEVGDGVLYLDGDQDLNLQGDLPNVTIPAAFSGSATIDADANVYGTVTVASSATDALLAGAFTLTVYGDFLRDDDTNGNIDFTTNDGLLVFAGESSRFDPGETLIIHGMTINLDDAANTLTLDESLRLQGNVDIQVGVLAIGSLNLRMQGTVAQTFTNDGGYTTDNSGYVIFENGLAANVIEGTAAFGNLDVRSGSEVQLGSAIDFSGILNVRSNEFDFQGFVLTFTDDYVAVSTVNYYTGNAIIQDDAGPGGTFAVATGIEYDLNFYENLSVGQASALDLLAAGIRNLNISTTAGGAPDLILPQATEITGKLTVATGETFDIAAGDFTMSGDAQAHSILGEVLDVTGPGLTQLVVTGNGTSFNGSTSDADARAIENLHVDIDAGESFNINNLESITGDVLVDNGTVGISLIDDPTNDNDAQFDGDLTVVDGTTTLTIPIESDGDGAQDPTVDGNILINDGTLVMGSSFTAGGTTDLGAGAAETGSINLNGNDLRQDGVFTHNGTGTIFGDGWFILDYTDGAGNFVLTTPLSVSNLEIDAQNAITQLTDDLTVTNSILYTSGTYDVNGLQVTFSGTDFEYVAGTFQDTPGTGLLLFNGSTQDLDLNDDFTLVNGNFELAQTASSLNINDVHATLGPWDFTIEGDFTMTNGDIELNTNDLVAQGDWTRVAGNITGGGFFVLDGGNTYDQGPATFSVERLSIIDGNADLDAVSNTAWRIEEYLQLGWDPVDLAAGSLDPGHDGTAAMNPILTFADDATIERQDVGATMDDEASYDGGINLAYTTDGSGAGQIQTSDEASATTIYDFLAQVEVWADRDFTVTQKLTVDRRNDPVTSPAQLDSDVNDLDANGDDVVSLSDGGWVELIDVGGDNAFVDPLNPLGVINVDYDNSVGPINTSDNELNPLFDIGQVQVDGDTDADDVLTHDDLRLGGNLQILDSGDLDINNNDLDLAGGYTQASDGTIINSGGTTSDVRLVGDTNWTFDAGGQLFIIGDDGVTVPPGPAVAPANREDRNYTFGVNTDSPDIQVTLANGNLNFALFGATLYLEQGMITTGDNIVILEQHSDANADQGSLNSQPTQGFVRTGDSHVVGNVRKYLGHQNGDGNIFVDAEAYDASIALTRVEFPVGAAPTSPSAFRPFALSFNTLPTASTNVTVNHKDVRPTGENGMPISTTEGFTITNFSDFYWLMTSDITIQPQVQFDVEARAEGYRDQYEPEEVEDIRFVRKFANNVDNPWVLQGSAGYDNSTDEQGAGIDDDMAVVIAKDAVGAVSSQGALFAYSQNNKAPFFTASLPDTTIAENDLLEFTYVINDPDIDDEGTMAAVTLPDGATFDAATGEFSWMTDYYDAGTHQVIISATDTYGGTRYDTAAVTVTNDNRPIAIDYTGDSADTVFVGEGDELSLQFTSTDADTNDTPTFAVTNWTGTADSSFNTATGLFNFTPAFGEVGMVYQLDVQVADGAGSTADTTAFVSVVKTNRAPDLALVDPADTTAEVDEGSLLEVLYTASDDDGDNITYSVVEENGDSTGAVMVDSVFTWTPAYTQAGVYNFWVIATDDGAPNKSDSLGLVVTVNDVNAPPVFTVTPPADTTIAVGETFTFQYEAEDPDEDVLTFEFADQTPDNATLDSETGVFTWTPQETAVWAIRLKVSDPAGLFDSTSSLIRALEFTVTVSGNVTYNNVDSAAIENAVVAVNGESDSTDAAGNYSVTDVGSGTYAVTATKTGDTGGILASDALKAALFALDSATYPLGDLAQLAADVNNSGAVTGADAQLILQKVVDDSVAFDRGDWVFTSEEVTLVSTDVTANLSGMVVGDVNGSYMSTIALAKDGKEKQNNVTATYTDNIRIAAEQEFEVPVSYSGALKAGAVTLQFSYPQEKLEFVSVKAPVSFVYKENDGVITLAWADLTGKNPLIVEDSPLMVFTFKATDKLGKQEVVNLTLENKSEISGTDGEVYKSSSISIPGIEQAVPKEFALSQNYPNPFNPSTVINYDLPVNGEVKLTIYNMLGQEVTKLVNAKQEAGSYKVNWNAGNFASGVYIYRITVEGVKNFVQTKKMILVK